MAIRVDEDFMKHVGLADMPTDEKVAFMDLAQAELEMRVGQGLGELLSPEQLQEFEAITDTAEASAWLSKNAPTYRRMTVEVFEKFKQEVREDRAKILAE